MTRLQWDPVGQRFFETGVDRGVLYPSVNGLYPSGVPWNGLTGVTEAPSGAGTTPLWADNMKYLNLVAREEFGATVTAYTYPDEFGACDGTAKVNGVRIGQQNRQSFGMSYRTKVGNDTDGQDHGYKLHLVYGALAAPSQKAYGTVNDTPAGIDFSWAVTTTPVDVGTIGGVTYQPTAILTISSLDVTAADLAALEDVLYGTAGANPRLPLPAEVVAMFSGSAPVSVTPTVPTFNAASGVVTIPTVAGVQYLVDGTVVTGTYTIPTSGQREVVVAQALPGFSFPSETDNDWQFTRT